MTSRIEEFRDRFNRIADLYIAHASAANKALETNMAELQADFAADLKADADLYEAVGVACMKTLERKMNEAGIQ